eukprot:237330-Amphidinium_carterae.1
MTTLWIPSNTFAGAVPEKGLGSRFWNGLYLEANHLEGQLPGVVASSSDLEYIVAGKTWMEGSIPTELGVTQRSLKA